MSRAWVQPANGVQPTGREKYGIGGPTESVTALPSMPSPEEWASTKPWHPDSPVFWIGAITLVTFGLAGAATSFRVGPAKASVSLGKS